MPRDQGRPPPGIEVAAPGRRTPGSLKDKWQRQTESKLSDQQAQASAEALAAVLERQLELCYEGFYLSGTHAQSLADSRACLRGAASEFERAVAWLEQAPRIQSLNGSCSSYFWKHIAERWAGNYVSNGAFLAAALHLGFRVRPLPNSSNATLNISRRAEGRGRQ